MSKRRLETTGAMLDLWRPPAAAGDPIGCLATTYTFKPGLFDEQCLARFLEIDSEPDREDLAFLLERESRLGDVYAGVLIDHTQAGVEHSLRWDVLPVRIRGAKQHAKVSLLVWTRHVRIIVSSANLSDQGYRTNQEVAVPVDLTPQGGNVDVLLDSIDFLRTLLRLVPGASGGLPTIRRAQAFLDEVRKKTRTWPHNRRRGQIRQHLVVTVPGPKNQSSGQSSLENALRLCRTRGGSPNEVWVASPFFDSDASATTASLCKLLARGNNRHLWFCVPSMRDESPALPRIAAPRTLIDTPVRYGTSVDVELLPDMDGDKNLRPWHAKMLAFKADQYDALLIGSSNFTGAGLGVGRPRNAEANLLTIVDRIGGREHLSIDAVWPEMEWLEQPSAAEWLGSEVGQEEEEQAPAIAAPPGFLSAIFRPGHNEIVLYLAPTDLPNSWSISAVGVANPELLTSVAWHQGGRLTHVELLWPEAQPPEKLIVQWEKFEAFLPLNVEDRNDLPPPAQLEHMSADDMLGILAAADPSAAFRAWAKQHQQPNIFDDELNSATPVDLDPLRRFDLHATFLHRIRRRARILAQMRSNLQRPVHSRQALEWRLKGLVGVQAVADRLVRGLTTSNGQVDKSLLTLTDFVIVLREIEYRTDESALTEREFHDVYDGFLRELVRGLKREVEACSSLLSPQLIAFWERVAGRCLR